MAQTLNNKAHTIGSFPFSKLLAMNLTSIERLHVMAMNDIDFFKQCEIDAAKCMRSDEDVLKDEVRAELSKAKLLMKEKFPLKTRLSFIKALVWPKSTYKQK